MNNFNNAKVSSTMTKFNSTYQKGDFGISEHQLKNIMGCLCGSGILRKDGSDAKGLLLYTARDQNAFDALINPEFNEHFQS